ncbi:MAG: exodeoxyribonuclease VII large subunit [Rickettsiales bacterium]|jgi:exodeoxyribonuclease VII large subunit|nr:exodeoxyribonuclease VII large subunit [Rickettsiales bacterium]
MTEMDMEQNVSRETKQEPAGPVFSVSEFSAAVKGLVEGAFGDISVRGEICGLKLHSSGTRYFDLKETAGGKDFILACVLWKWTKIDVKLEEGLEVVVSGRATTYGGRSSYQLTVASVEIAGEGALFKIIEERRKRLAAEGIFDPAHKRPIPRFPRAIGVVTSQTGAVIRDILHRIGDRFPCRVVVAPSAVQGEGAPAEIIAGIALLNRLSPAPDVIIVARGGGSLQDLMAFNDEGVVRAAYSSAVPVISAVGHETDTTLMDYAADLRAPTPTAAAELATPLRSELARKIAEGGLRAMNAVAKGADGFRLAVANLWARVKNPAAYVEDMSQRVDDRFARVGAFVSSRHSALSDRLSFAGKMLRSLNFANVLSRGYAMLWHGGRVVDSVSRLAELGSAEIQMGDGRMQISAGRKRAVSRKGDDEPTLF